MKKQMKNMLANTTLLALLVIALLANTARAEWTVDLSRRTQQMRRQELNPNYDRSPAAVRTYEGEEPPTNTTSRADSTAFVSAKPIDGSVDAPVSRSKSDQNFVERIFDPGEPSQDIVILNTERGFVPNTIRVRKDGRYTVHVVNVNEKEKNVSFILDGFSEHHATFFGKVKTFKLEPRKEGVYSFLSPETAVEGRFIVYSAGSSPQLRVPATAQLSSPSQGGGD